MSCKAGIVLAIDKPVGWTSFQVVNKIKWHIKRTFGLKKFKIGHAGTLDPLASGLLLVCVGGATKQIEQLQSGRKDYSGTMVIGATTPCFDLEQAVDRYYPTGQITTELIENVRQQFVGQIEQFPPMFSAVKVDGKRAYVSAREGEKAELASKKVEIESFEITAYRPSRNAAGDIPAVAGDNPKVITDRELYRNPQGCVPEWLPQIDFKIRCGKGTYIRSIARDFGEALGSGAFLSALRRERIGEYSITEAISLDAIEEIITPSNEEYRNLLTLA